MTEKAPAELNARFIQGAITLLGRSDNGAWHRAVEVARRLVAHGLWDGEERIEFNAYALHDRLFGVAQGSPLDLVEGKDYFFPDRRRRLGPKWPNLVNRRTSVLDGQTRYEIAWTDPKDEALASLYVTKGKQVADGLLAGLKLTPDHARIDLVGGSVVADGEGSTARAAYRAADRDLRLFRQDPADLLRKLSFAEQRAARLQQSNDELRARLAQLHAEQETLVRNFQDLQRQAEQQAANSAAVITRLDKLLKAERQRWGPGPADTVALLVFDHDHARLAEATSRIGDLLLSGWRVEQMSSGADRTVVLMVNPSARFVRPPVRRSEGAS